MVVRLMKYWAVLAVIKAASFGHYRMGVSGYTLEFHKQKEYVVIMQKFKLQSMPKRPKSELS